MEARRLLQESGMKTAMDEGYINQVSHKWRASGLLEGIQNPYTQGVLAMLLENEMDHLKSLNEDTLSTGVGSFTKYIFPILRRVFPNLIANQIVSVQPMTAPIGGIFTYEMKYGNSKGNSTAGNNLIQDFQKFFSSEYIDYELLAADFGTGSGSGTAATKQAFSATDVLRRPFQWLPIHPKDSEKDYHVELTFRVVGSDGGTNGAGYVQTVRDDGAGNLVLHTTQNSADPVGTSVGTVNYNTGAWTLDLSGLNAANKAVSNQGTGITANSITATYYYQSEKVSSSLTGQLNSSQFVSGSTATQNSAIPEVNLDLALTTIEAVTRKLKARWSAEAMDDLRAFHGLNAETELVAGISNEIALELDREVIDDLLTGSQFSANFNLNPGAGAGGAGQLIVNREIDQIRSLLTTIDSVSARIHRSSLRAPANFIVVAPEIGAILSQLTSHGDFSTIGAQSQAPSYGPMNSNFGVQRIGTLMNKFAVYQDPFLDASSSNKRILVGLKGNSFLDAGYVYAPYVPLQVTPTFLDPDDFTFRKGLRTRYAKKMLRPEYYGSVTVQGLPTIAG